MLRVIKATSRARDFTDSDRVEEILETFSNLDLLHFNRVVGNLNFWRLLNAAPTNGREGETVARLLKMSRRWNRSIRNSDRFINCLIRVLSADAINEFEQLSMDSQQEIWSSYYSRSSGNLLHACADKAFLRLLNTTGFPVGALQEFSEASVQQYVESVRRSQSDSIANGSSNFDLSMPTDEFRRNVAIYFKNYRKRVDGQTLQGSYMFVLDPYFTQILIMLRAVYGEENLWEVLERFSVLDAILCPNEIIDLLDNWDELKHYTSDWIKQFHSLEHTTD